MSYIIPFESVKALVIRNSSDWWLFSDSDRLAIYWNKRTGASIWLAKIDETDPKKLIRQPNECDETHLKENLQRIRQTYKASG